MIFESSASHTGTSTSLKVSTPNIRGLEPEKSDGNGNIIRIAEESTLRNRHDPIRVLIMGRSGSGKTYTVQDASDVTAGPMASGFYKATKDIEVTMTNLNGQRFELIDTPGFDNVGMSDADVFLKIATYLLDPQRINEEITGIIYVHRAGDTVHSRSTLQNLRVMANIFLGETGISHLTFLVTQIGTQSDIDYRVISHEMRTPNSAFSQVCSMGAKPAANPGRAGLIKTLEAYTSQAPIKLLAQLDGSHNSLSGFRQRVEGSLALDDYQLVRLEEQEQQVSELAKRLANPGGMTEGLFQQLRRTQLERTSLRSQLGFQENVEYSQVVQNLSDLNRIIDDIWRFISAYLADNCVQSAFDKDLADATTFDSRDLLGLKRLLGHQDGSASLIVSSDGRALGIEDFLDYSTRNFLCHYLVDKIFRPFHPQMDSLQSKVLLANYESIQKRERQSIAGKWRSETFKAAHKIDAITKSRIIFQHLRSLVDCWFEPLTRHVFGANMPLEERHYNHFRSLIETAWDWNSTLKGDVIMLGDFVQTFFAPSQFDPESMEEFEPSRLAHEPSVILGTIALGLQCQRAVGQGSPVEKRTMYKAVVMTEQIFH